MTPLAWTVFAAFLIWVVWDGVRRSSSAANLEDYYAGGRRIPWWAAGLSVMATQASAITVIGTTGQGHEGGLGFIHTYYGLPFAVILLCVFLIPVYRSLPILTAYEYLETRFGPETRALGSFIFLLSRCLALAFVIHAPAIVLSAMLEQDLVWMIVAVGGLTTLYTVFGGVSAVVWTDVKQMSVILVGLGICFGMLAWDVFGELGVDGALRAAGAAGKLDAVELVPAGEGWIPAAADSDAPKTFWDDKYNLWSGLFGGLFLMLSYFGCDQSQVQRILTNATANESRRALLLSGFVKIPMQLGVLAVGVLLWLSHAARGDEPLLYDPTDLQRAEQTENQGELAAHRERFEVAQAERSAALRAYVDADGAGEVELQRYQVAVREAIAARTAAAKRFSAEFGSEDAPAGKKGDTNYVFPQWLLNNLPSLLLGLVLAAVFAAAMSSVDSVLNSLSAATVVDFWRRFMKPDATDRQQLIAGRTMTFVWGVVATGTAVYLASGEPSSIIEEVNRVGSFFYGTLLGMFVLAIFVPRAGRVAGFVGTLGGITAVLVVHNTLRVQFLWYNLVGLLGVLLVGGVIALALPRQPTPQS